MSDKKKSAKCIIILAPRDQRVIENLSMSAKHIFRKEQSLLFNIFIEDCNPTLPRCIIHAWRKEYEATQIASSLLN